LRDRREDIQMLATEFMRRLGRKHGVHVKGFTDASLRVLNDHSWPGNVRELQNVVERAVILCGDNGMLEPEHLGLTPQTIAAGPSAAAPSAANITASSGEFPTLADLERQHIFVALDRCKGNRTHAAKILDVSIRTLRNKLHEYNGTGAKSEDEKVDAED
jgi:DNA-binding NtrC family response regulator